MVLFLYCRSLSGVISSFNNNNGLGQELINHNYPICINQFDNYCDVALSATSFDLDGTAPACNDKLVLGANTYCGSGTASFGTAGALTCKFSFLKGQSGQESPESGTMG